MSSRTKIMLKLNRLALKWVNYRHRDDEDKMAVLAEKIEDCLSAIVVRSQLSHVLMDQHQITWEAYNQAHDDYKEAKEFMLRIGFETPLTKFVF